jgi:hypothetical protein
VVDWFHNYVRPNYPHFRTLAEVEADDETVAASVPVAAHERSRLLVLDLLESHAGEQEMHVRLERVNDRQFWMCLLKTDGSEPRESAGVGETAREAINEALRLEGLEIPD